MATDIKSTHPLNDPKGLTTKVSPLSDGYIPYQVDDKTGLADGPLKIDVDKAISAITGKYYFADVINDDGTQVLPTVTANYPAHGFIHVCTTTAIVESAEFEYGSDGNVQIIRGTVNVVVNADTDGKVCLGTAAGQNPLTVKNRLGGVRQVMIILWYK